MDDREKTFLHSEKTDDRDSHDMIRVSIEKRLDEIEAMASTIIDWHWQQILQYEKAHPGWQNRSRLSLRCYRKGNNLRLEWSGIKWKKEKSSGKSLRFHLHIEKGRGNGYSLSKLFAYAMEWERPLVEEAEQELAWIRREAYHLNRALFSLRYAREAALKSGDQQQTDRGMP